MHIHCKEVFRNWSSGRSASVIITRRVWVRGPGRGICGARPGARLPGCAELCCSMLYYCRTPSSALYGGSPDCSLRLFLDLPVFPCQLQCDIGLLLVWHDLILTDLQTWQIILVSRLQFAVVYTELKGKIENSTDCCVVHSAVMISEIWIFKGSDSDLGGSFFIWPDLIWPNLRSARIWSDLTWPDLRSDQIWSDLT